MPKKEALKIVLDGLMQKYTERVPRSLKLLMQCASNILLNLNTISSTIILPLEHLITCWNSISRKNIYLLRL